MHIGKKNDGKAKNLKNAFLLKKLPSPPRATQPHHPQPKSGVGEWGMGREDSTYCHGVLDAECQAPQAVLLIPQPPWHSQMKKTLSSLIIC